MSRCDSVWTEATASTRWPRRSKANSGSTDSMASAPRLSRRAWSALGAAPAAASGCGPRSRRRPRGRERLRPRLLRLLGAGEDPVHAVVVQALVGADEGAIEGRLDGL